MLSYKKYYCTNENDSIKKIVLVYLSFCCQICVFFRIFLIRFLTSYYSIHYA